MNIDEIGRNVIKDTQYIIIGDIADKGIYLGYDGNTIIDLAMDAGIYGEDGAGYTYITRDELSYYKNKDLQRVLLSILDEANSDKVMVLNDC